MKKLLLSACVCAAMYSCASAQPASIALPEPQKTGGKPLMEALAERRTTREYGDKELDMQTLSNLLWAAYGFNRPDKRTVPSSMNKQSFRVYVFLAAGTYLYDAKENKLQSVVAKDLRSLTGKQDFVGKAPLNLVFAYDKTLTTNQNKGYLDCGYLSQNVYLYAASAGLNTVARAFFDADALGAALGLDKNMEIVLTQTVGYPK